MRRFRFVWFGLFLLALAMAGAYALQNFATAKGGAEDACVAFLQSKLGDVDAKRVEVTLPEVYFRSRFDKRFKSVCTYDGATVNLEGSPFGPWKVMGAEGLD